MPKFAANLHYLFTEVPFLERFEEAARAGFRGVEFQVPYDWPAEELARRLRECNLDMVLIDTPVGQWGGGDRGMAAIPGREKEFGESLDLAIDYARTLGCGTIHVMCGRALEGIDRNAMQETYVANLRLAAARFRPHGIHAVIEPINNRLDLVPAGAAYTTEGMRGYYLNRTDDAVRTIAEVATDNLFLHLDCYHMQLMEGHLAETFRRHMSLVRHIQIAGVPGRHEPDVGEIHYPYLFNLFDELGYPGWVGCEYRPKSNSHVGLAWGTRWGIGKID